MARLLVPSQATHSLISFFRQVFLSPTKMSMMFTEWARQTLPKEPLAKVRSAPI